MTDLKLTNNAVRHQEIGVLCVDKTGEQSLNVYLYNWHEQIWCVKVELQSSHKNSQYCGHKINQIICRAFSLHSYPSLLRDCKVANQCSGIQRSQNHEFIFVKEYFRVRDSLTLKEQCKLEQRSKDLSASIRA